ncbi:MAG: hypothetical protein ACREE0_15395 [Phenylobacterium sp.]
MPTRAQTPTAAPAESFSAKFALALKALSISRGRLASDLEVDKSVVGRWATGAVKPSDHNLSRLTALIAERVPGFTALDWDRSAADFAATLGANASFVAGLVATSTPALPFPLLDQIRSATDLRGSAYEGFYRSTRPYVLSPGHFVHDHSMVRLDAQGLLTLRIGTAGTVVEGWILPLHNQLFVIAADITSGALLFGILHGVASARAQVLDGLTLAPSLDPGRTPVAYAIIFERIGDLSGDRQADEAHFAELAAKDPLAPEGSISDELRAHLLRDVGPQAKALGGDLLLSMPISRSMARGPAYGEPTD